MTNGLPVRSSVGPDLPLHLLSLSDREQFRLTLADRAGLVDRVTAILAHHNPVGLPVLAADEFRPEAETIVASLAAGDSPARTQTLIHREFVNWFDDEMAGPASRYRDVAVEVWQVANQWFTTPVVTLG